MQYAILGGQNKRTRSPLLSRKFHAETTLLASAFAKPMKNENCFRSISQLNVLHFCLRSAFTFIFQPHMKSL